MRSWRWLGSAHWRRPTGGCARSTLGRTMLVSRCRRVGVRGAVSGWSAGGVLGPHRLAEYNAEGGLIQPEQQAAWHASSAVALYQAVARHRTRTKRTDHALPKPDRLISYRQYPGSMSVSDAKPLRCRLRQAQRPRSRGLHRCRHRSHGKRPQQQGPRCLAALELQDRRTQATSTWAALTLTKRAGVYPPKSAP